MQSRLMVSWLSTTHLIPTYRIARNTVTFWTSLEHSVELHFTLTWYHHSRSPVCGAAIQAHQLCVSSRARPLAVLPSLPGAMSCPAAQSNTQYGSRSGRRQTAQA